MTRFHKDLKYHEDKTPKQALSQDDIEFLTNLQKEMNTQDTVGQADPRFWVIAQTKRIYHVSDNATGWQLYDQTNEKVVAENPDDLYQYLIKLLPEINKEIHDTDPDTDFTVQKTRRTIEIQDNQNFENFCGLKQITNFLNTYGIHDYCLIYYQDVPDTIVKDTLFLTQKAAEEHLRNYGYNYHEDAHTYAMTADRSPEIERLYQVLRKTNWQDLIR